MLLEHSFTSLAIILPQFYVQEAKKSNTYLSISPYILLTYSPAYRVFSNRSLKIIAISGLISQIIFHVLFIATYFPYRLQLTRTILFILILSTLLLSVFFFYHTRKKKYQDSYIFLHPKLYQNNLSYELSEKKITYIDAIIYLIFLCCLIN